MRSRSIDNLMAPSDVELVRNFIRDSIERFEKYDGRIRMAPRRFKTDELQRLYIEVLGAWDTAVKTLVPDESSTYLEVIRGSDASCPIEGFLKALMQIIEQAIPAGNFVGVLDSLEAGLVACEFPCKCPSEPE